MGAGHKKVMIYEDAHKMALEKRRNDFVNSFLTINL